MSRLEVDPNSVDGDKYRVAVAVAEIIRPFVLNGSDEFIPGNITIKEIARVARMKNPNKVVAVIDAKQQLTQGQVIRGCIVFSDHDGNTWNFRELGSKKNSRIKKAARMAGHRGAIEGGKAASNTFKSMLGKFALDYTRIRVQIGPPLFGLRDESIRPRSQRWTNAARAKILDERYSSFRTVSSNIALENS